MQNAASNNYVKIIKECKNDSSARTVSTPSECNNTEIKIKPFYFCSF